MTLADALRALADLVESGISLRLALVGWREHVIGPLKEPVRAVGRTAHLGADIGSSLAPLASSGALDLGPLLESCAAAEASAAAMLRELATSMELRDERRMHAHAAAAAARTSQRMLTGLPLLVLPFLALSGVPIADALGLGLLAAGGALAFAGMRWVDAITPTAVQDDIALQVADLVRNLLRGGSSTGSALDVAAEALRDGHLDRARACVRLGRPWPQALMASSDEGMAALGHLLDRCGTTGLPASGELERFARMRRSQAKIDFERAARAAPVRMVVPLVVCALPAFCLMVVAPFLRGVGSA